MLNINCPLFSCNSTTDINNNIFAVGGGQSTNLPIYSFFNAYVQTAYAGGGDGSILSFQSNLQTPPAWSTYFGANFYEVIYSAATFKNRKLYIVGATSSPTSSTQLFNQQPGGAWVQGALGANGTTDGFITRFNIKGVSTSGIAESKSETNFTIFPNPTNGQISIAFDVFDKGDVSLLIYNLLGDVVYVEKLNSQHGRLVKTIDVSEFSNGIYLVQVVANNIKQSKKLIIQK